MAGLNPSPRATTSKDEEEILIPVVSGVRELLFSPVNPFNDRPGFVAGAEPETGLGAAVWKVTRLNCRIWASRDKSGYSPRVNAYNGEVCGPYLESLGENPDPGGFAPLFSGGQCEGVSYNITWNRFIPGLGSSAQSETKPGPIRITRALDPTDDDSQCAPGDTFKRWTLLSGGVGVNMGSGCGVTVTSINVARADAAPDTCGNPRPQLEPPATVTPGTPITPTITIDLPGVGPVTVNVDLSGSGNPVICAEGTETCIEINPGDGDPNNPGDGTPGDGGGEPGPPPGDIGSPGAGESTGPGGDAEGEAPEGSVLVGLFLTLVIIPELSSQYADGVYRGVCYIYMGVPSRLDHDPAGAMLRESQFVFAEKDNLTAWRVKANGGYGITVVPYYREITPP